MTDFHKYLRFAFDLGTNSIGWAVYALDRAPTPDAPATVTTLLGCGVRLFDDGRNPKDGNSLAEMRRVPRSARRRRDRFIERRANLLSLLVTLGLMPADADARHKLASLDPYALRARGLEAELPPHELGRALFHLNQRRGFKSNRRADRRLDGKEKGKIAEASKRLKEQLAAENVRTFGALLWHRHGGADGNATPRVGRRAVRIRLEGEGAKALYDIYPTRDMLEHEFDLLIARQRKDMPHILTDAAIAELKRVMFFQRPLKPVERGRCTLVSSEPRLLKALPSVEERVIYETLNHLRYGAGVTRDKALTITERDLIAQPLLQGKSKRHVTFDTIRAALKLGSTIRFNREDDGKSDLHDVRSQSAEKLASKDRFGPRWHSLPLEERDRIVSRLIGSEEAAQIQEWLMRELELSSEVAAAIAEWRPSEREQALARPDRFGDSWKTYKTERRASIIRRLTGNEEDSDLAAWLKCDYGLDDEAALATADWAPREGVARLGKTANDAVLDELKNDVITYNEAVARAGWDHSPRGTGVIELPLPYYGQIIERHVAFGSGKPEDPAEKRYGRVTNPTVHIGLGQLRRLVNALVPTYGEPSQIVVELARDLKMTHKQKEREQRENAANKKLNDERRLRLQELGQDDTGENRLRLRLYEEQERAGGGVALCPYSLKPIGIEKLYSAEVEIDHILPYSRTLDDTRANRILCYRWTNRQKRRDTPHEAFANPTKALPGVPSFDAIVAAAAGLPANKRWRFAADAMERFEKRERDFLARQINETRHLSRLARLYLAAATGTTDQVYVTTGQLTAMLRARWGLNSLLGDDNRKVRTDHRHHAIDAITIGAIDRSLLQEMARRAGAAEEEGRDGITRDVPDPFPGFREAARAAIGNVVVSVKPEHGTGGALHEDTAYGLVKNPAEAAEIGNLVFRKPLADLNVNEIDRVRDPHLRKLLRELAAPFRNQKGKLEDEKGLKQALSAFRIREQHGDTIIERLVRRVRIGKAKTGEVHIKDRRTGSVYKALLPGENHHIDIVLMRDGAWRGFPATVFEVNQPGWRPDWERERLGGKLVMRVLKGDMVEVDCDDGQRRIMTVHRLSPSNNILYLAPHTEGGALQKRHDDKDDPFRWDFANIGGLKKRNARKVKVDEIGRTRSCPTNVG
jgi:CRISPR-associated endonuclease Csn1